MIPHAPLFTEAEAPSWLCKAIGDYEKLEWICTSDYTDYVVAAYLVFAAVLLWDFVAPRIRTRQLLRAARLLAARRAAAAAQTETPPQ